jgi:hypothetical protein
MRHTRTRTPSRSCHGIPTDRISPAGHLLQGEALVLLRSQDEPCDASHTAAGAVGEATASIAATANTPIQAVVTPLKAGTHGGQTHVQRVLPGAAAAAVVAGGVPAGRCCGAGKVGTDGARRAVQGACATTSSKDTTVQFGFQYIDASRMQSAPNPYQQGGCTADSAS